MWIGELNLVGRNALGIANEHFKFSCTIYTDEAQTVPLNLTGYSAKLVLSRNGAALATLTDANGGLALGGALGTIAGNSRLVSGPSLDPATFVAGVHRIVLEVRNGFAEIEHALRGDAELLADLSP